MTINLAMTKKSIQISLLTLFAFMLNGCSTAPRITQSNVVLPVTEKVRSLEFVYHEAAMRSSSYGAGRVAVADLGFYGFSKLLVKEAPIIFASNHVAVVDAKLLQEDQRLNLDLLPKGAGNVSLPILLVEPRHGYESSNGHATMGGYVFEALLIEPSTHKTIWKASIDTNVWKGEDFLMKNIQRDVYDKSYADQFLTQVVTQLKADGVVE